MGGDLSLRVTLRAQDLASGNIRGFGAVLGNLSGPAKLAASGLLAIASAAAAVAVKTVQMAANWQTSLTQLVTGAGESQSNLALVSNGMLNMAVATGTTTQQLSAGMYQIESAGYHGANGLMVLQNAAEGAKVGNADLAAVANGTTTALTDYGMAASQSASVVNDLIATVANGKTTMQALSTSLANILPVSSATGVSLKDTSAALATMTGEGVPAAQAATFLRQTLLALNAPTTAASKQLAEVGLTTQQISDKMKQSLPAALQMITNAVAKKFPVGSAKYIAALKNIVVAVRICKEPWTSPANI